MCMPTRAKATWKPQLLLLLQLHKGFAQWATATANCNCNAAAASAGKVKVWQGSKAAASQAQRNLSQRLQNSLARAQVGAWTRTRFWARAARNTPFIRGQLSAFLRLPLGLTINYEQK